MSENLKRAESLFNRIMNNGKESTPFKPSIKHKSDKGDRDSHGYNRHDHHNHNNGSSNNGNGSNSNHNHSYGNNNHGHHHNNNNANHNHGHNGHSHNHNYNRNKHRAELLNHEALKLPEQILGDLADVQQHILPYCWTIWYHHRYAGKKRTSIDDKNKYLSMTTEVEFPKYGSSTQEVTKHVASVEQMWLNMSILGQPKDVSIGTEYLIFKSGINPAWEDPFNTKGGRWIFKFHRKANEDESTTSSDEKIVRERTSLIWERLVLRILSGSFISLEENNEELVRLLLNDINGIVLSIRKEEDIISIWNSNLNTKSKKLSNVPTRRILCDSILRVIRECDVISSGGDIVNTISTSESSNERVKNVSFEYRLHSDYNTNRRFNNNHHGNNHHNNGSNNGTSGPNSNTSVSLDEKSDKNNGNEQ